MAGRGVGVLKLEDPTWRDQVTRTKPSQSQLRLNKISIDTTRERE